MNAPLDTARTAPWQMTDAEIEAAERASDERLRAYRRQQAREAAIRHDETRRAAAYERAVSSFRPIGEIIRPIVERAAAAVREHEDWIDRLNPAEARVIWTRPIHEWRDMAGVVLPFTTDGIARLQVKAEGAA